MHPAVRVLGNLLRLVGISSPEDTEPHADRKPAAPPTPPPAAPISAPTPPQPADSSQTEPDRGSPSV